MNPLIDITLLGVTAAVGRLPRPAALSLGAAVGRLGAATAQRKRGRISENLVSAGVDEVDAAYRRFWRHMGINFTEMLWITGRDEEGVFGGTV